MLKKHLWEARDFSRVRLHYYEPEEGTNVWCDGMVMTTDCEDTELAQGFMNFMTDPENAMVNSSYVGYTSPVKEVSAELAESDYEGVSAYQPNLTAEKNESFAYQELDIKEFYADLWTKVKSY